MRGVVKLGGACGNECKGLVRELAERTRRGEEWLLVHGAGGAMNALCEERGVPLRHVTSPSGYRSRFVGDVERELFETAASRVSQDLLWALRAEGVRGVALFPDLANTAEAERKDILRSVEDGRVRLLRGNWSGTVTRVETTLLEEAWRKEMLPVLPPLARDRESGKNLNVDGDRLAAVFAGALGAEVLLILSNVPGLLADPKDAATLIPSGSPETWDVLEKAAQGNMKRKLRACREALEAGVPRVVLGDSRVRRPLEAALSGRGTHLWNSPSSTVLAG